MAKYAGNIEVFYQEKMYITKKYIIGTLFEVSKKYQNYILTENRLLSNGWYGIYFTGKGLFVTTVYKIY